MGRFCGHHINQGRAREAIEKAIPMREVMAPDAESWAGNALDQLLTFYEGNTKAALAAYVGVLDEKETTAFINEVLRVYNKNYDLAEMGPRVDSQYAPSRYVRPGDRK